MAKTTSRIAKYTVRKLVKMNPKIGTDDSFERPSGCWDNKQASKYIAAVFKGQNGGSNIVVTNNVASEGHSVDVGCPESEAYFKARRSKGESYTSIDGKHRRGAICDFVGKKIPFTGVGYDVDGNTFFFNQTFFHKMPESYQQEFLDCEIAVEEFTTLRHEMPELFIGINDGVPLSDQQKRNAIQTPIAKWARDMSKHYEKLFSSMFSDKAIAQMKDCELVSKIYAHIADNSSDVGSEGLDSLYMLGQGESDIATSYDTVVRDATVEVANNLNSIRHVTPSKKIAAKTHIPLILALVECQSSNLQIKDVVKFHERVLELDENAQADSRAQQVRDEEAAKKNNVAPPPVGNYYHEWCRTNWGSNRAKRQSRLGMEIKNNPAYYGLV